MSTPENASGGSGAPGSERVRLLVDLGACLAAWRRSLAQGIRPSDPAALGLRGLSGDLAARLPGVGFGGIAYHLRELVRRFDANGAAGDVRESLEALAHLSEQARASLSPPEQASLVRSGPPPALHAGQGAQQPADFAVHPAAGAPAPPPMLTIGPRGRDTKHEESGIMPMNGPESIQPPRLVDSGIRVPGERPAPLPAFAPPGQGLPIGAEGARPAHAVPPAHQQPPHAAPSPNAAQARQSAPFEVVPPQAKPANAPNLLVRSMLGLRARSGRPASGSMPAQNPPGRADDSGEHKSSLLGLRRSQSQPGVSQPGVSHAPSAPPPLLNRSPSGLPPLPPGPSTPQPRNHSPAANESGARNVHDLLSGIERSRGGRRGEKQRGRSTLLRHRDEEGGGWRVGAIAAAVLALVLGGLTTLILVLTRETDEAERSTKSAAAEPDPGQSAAPVTSNDLPRPKLLNENESFRALLAQVHGRGKESPQLRALVDEQAALAARAISPQRCEGTKASCEEWAKIRESVLGQDVGTKRIQRRRSAGSPDRIRSRWLVGLKLPEIPVEDDPRVQRSFEFYTENPVGRETFQSMLFRCGAHRDLIQSTLIRHGLPADLLAIVFAESGCEPQATSPVGAAGLWQFMPATARAYHLRVKEDVVDERRSPPKATEAAVRYLRDLHDKLVVYRNQNVWDLVFASYNMGPFAMVARIERAGGDVGFWDLIDADLLPDETSQYAPAVQAIALILNNLQRLKFSGAQIRAPQLTSDLEVAPGTRLSLIARAAATSVVQIRALNLDISGDRTPDVPNFAVQVPKDVIWQARDTLKDLLARRDDADLCVSQDFDWGRQRFTKEMAAACKRKLSTPGALQ